jgi:GTP-binding protein
MGESRTGFEGLSFRLGAASLRQLPPDEGREVAFGGRSNAGKSTAINTLAGRRALARTSKTPGRTQQINFFDLDVQRRVVDLPGYGFARAPRDAQARWGALVQGYLSRRRCLGGLVLLVDVRRPLMPLDLQMLQWCEHADLPVHLLLTKSDKLGRSQAQQALKQTRAALEDLQCDWSAQLFSGLKRSGLPELLQRLAPWLELPLPDVAGRTVMHKA